MTSMSKHGGVSRMLSLISNAQKTLVDVFENGPIRETHENANDLAKLKDARAVISTNRGYRVHPKMAGLINHFLETETSSYLDTQHADRIPEIRDLIDQYFDAKHKNQQTREPELFDTIEAVVYEISADIEESCRRLSNRLHYDFGYGKTLTQKRKENQLAIEQAEKLLKGLNAFTFSLLAEMSGGNSSLNTLLCHEMHSYILKSQKQLDSILSHLRILMMKYRNRERDKDLINSFDRFFDIEPNWKPNDDEILPDEIKQIDGRSEFWLSNIVEFCHYPNVDDLNQEDELAMMVEKITAEPIKRDDLPEIKEAELRAFTLDLETLELIEEDIDAHCDSFFTQAYIEKGKVSAFEYYQKSMNKINADLEPLNCAQDVWLFSVLNFYSAMLPTDRKDFKVLPRGSKSYETQINHIGYGNLHLEDVLIERN